MPDLLGKIEDVNKWYQIINLKMDEEIVSYKEKMDQKIAYALNDQIIEKFQTYDSIVKSFG